MGSPLSTRSGNTASSRRATPECRRLRLSRRAKAGDIRKTPRLRDGDWSIRAEHAEIVVVLLFPRVVRLDVHVDTEHVDEGVAWIVCRRRIDGVSGSSHAFAENIQRT